MNALTMTLNALLARADSHRGFIKDAHLKRGLIVSVKKTAAYTSLRLTRSGGAVPSQSEWDTVIQYWPSPIAKIEGPQLQDNGRALVGRWANVEQMELINGG